MTTVEQVAEEAGVDVREVLAAATDLGFVVSSGESGLSGAEHRRLRIALGAPTDLPAVAAGSHSRNPSGADPADKRTLRERHDALADHKRPAKKKVSVRTVTRATIGICLLVAIFAAVTSLGNWNEGSVDDVTRFTAADAGTCIDFDDDFRGGIAVLECELPHDAELFAVLASEGGPNGGTTGDASAPYPGADAMLAEAEQKCAPLFQDYVGIADDALDAVDMVFLLPTAETWPVGDRTVHCLLEAPGNKLAESWRNAAN